MGDDSFYTRLKSDPTALTNLQTGLKDKYATVATTSTDADKTAAVDAATTYVLVTAKSTTVGTMVSDLANNLPSIADSLGGATPDYTKAMNAIVGGKSEAEIAATLADLIKMSDALGAMQTAATSGTSVNSDAFFAGSKDPVGLSQLALLAAVAKAVSTDAGGGIVDVAAAASVLAAGGTLTSGTALTAFGNALNGTTDPASNQFAYLSAVKDQLPISL
jgi:hypothetical protein